MKKQFQSKSVPRGTRTIWRYLGALFILFTFAIGNVWADEETLTWAFSGINTACTDPSGITKSSTSATSTIQSSMAATFSNVKTKSDASSSGYSSKLQATAGTYLGDKSNKQLLADQYVGASFTIPSGYVFKLKSISFPYCAISTGINARLTISDGETDVTPSDGSASSGGTATISYSDATMAKELSGDVTVKIWFWMPGSTSTGKYAGLGDLAITGDLVESTTTPIAVTGITIAPSSATIKVGKTVTLGATITPSNATDKAVTWAVTSGSTYASVDESGVVTGVAAGTATITATAHDGSGVKQTATITVEECPTSGTIFSMTVTDPDGTVYTDVTNAAPQEIGATYTGGKAYATSTSSSKRSPKITGEEFDFNVNSGGSVAVKVELDCDLAEGDIISFTSSADKEFKIQKTATDGLYTTSGKSFTIPESSPLIGEDVIYILRNNSACKFSAINIVRPLYRTITLEYADGATADGSIEVIDGTAATKPADPTWAHHRFDGWYNGSDPYVWTANVTGNLTLTAHWTQLYTVTYAAGDGTATGDAPTQVDKAAGETFKVAANTFAVDGKDFDKWNDGTNDYNPDDTYTVGTGNVVLTAQWKTASAKYTVIFKDGDTELGTKLFEVGSVPSDAEINKTKPLFTFAAWQKDEADIALDDAFWATVVKDATVTLTARWTKAYAQSIDMEQFVIDNTKAGNWHAYLDSKGYAYASSNMSLDSLDGGKTKNNYQYLGLKFNKNSENTYVEGNLQAQKLMIVKVGAIGNNTYMKIDGAKVTEPAIVGGVEADSAAAYTYWYYDTDKTFSLFHENGGTSMLKGITITDPFEVSYNVNGGDPVAAQYGEPSVTLPSATKGIDSFLGWFDAAEGGNKIGEAGASYTPTADIELFAHWEAVSTDARLASISFSSDAGTLSPAFDPEVVNYTYTMPYGTAAVPTITGATSVNAKAKAPVIDAQAANWGDVAHIHGVAQSDDTKDYYITMLQAPKDGVEIIGVVTTGGTNKTVSGLYKGDATVNLDGDQKIGSGKYIYVTLASGYTFEETDVLVVDVKAKSDLHSAPALEITTGVGNIDGSVWKSIANADYELHLVTIPLTGIAANQTSIGLKRSDHQNTWVNGLKVYRPMMPEMTAITINGEDAVKGTGNTFTITLPEEGTNLAALTVVPTIIRNAPHATTPEAVISNEGAWKEGANTYRVMDKDGDYTDYTITITLQGQAPAPVITTQPAGVAYCAGSEPTLEVVATGDELHYAWFKEAGETDEAVGEDAASYTIASAGTYYVVVTNHVDGKLDASVTSANAVVTLNVAAAITTQPTNKRDVVAGSEVTLSVVATNATGYQWYICDDAEKANASAISGAEAANYVFNCTANAYYYCVVGNACGDDITSNVVSVKLEPEGCNTFASKPAAAPYNYEQTGEWTFYNVDSNGADKSTDNVFDDGKNFDDEDVVVANTRRFALKFEKDVESVTLYGVGGNDKSFTKVSVSDEMKKNTYTELTSTATKTDLTSQQHIFTIEDMIIPAGKYAWFELSGSLKFFKICYTAALVEPKLPTLVNQELCAGAAYQEFDATITNEAACEGTVSYKWFSTADTENPVAETAEFTPSTDGTYYVVVTHAKAGHITRTAQSANLSVAHFDALTLVSHSEDVFQHMGTAATLSVVATGKNVAYVWYTCSNAAGDDAVAIDPAETEAELAIASILEGVHYYKVVISHDCDATTLSHVFKVEGWDQLEQVDVTETTTWNMANSAENAIDLSKAPYSCQNELLLLANIDGVNNNTTFNAQALKFEGQHIGRTQNEVKHLAGRYLQFNVTKSGYVSVTFASNGSNARTVKVNGLKCQETSSSGATYKTFVTFVQPGSVEIIGMEGTSEKQYVRISEVKFTVKETPDYSRDVTYNIGTLCVDHNVVAGGALGATFYQIASRNEQYNDKIDFEEVLPNEELKAGEPYIFQSTTGRIDLFFGETEATQPVAIRGMIGNFAASTLAIDENNQHTILYIAQNKLWSCENLVGQNLILNDHRAYIDMTQVPTYAEYQEAQTSNPAPRRRVTLGKNAEQVVTGVENLNASEQPVKLLINGQIFILRGEKMFDATGRLVK